MIDIMTRAPIGTVYEVETDLDPSVYGETDYNSDKESLLSDLRMVPGVNKADFGLRHMNGEPYVVAYITIERQNDDSFVWNFIEKVFTEHGAEA